MKTNNISNIKDGDLLAWSDRSGLYTNIIRFFTMSEYTHVGIAIIENGELYVVEAVAPEVRKIRVLDRMPFFHIPMNIEMTSELKEKANSFLGKKYSTIQAMLSWFNIYINDDKWYCTELTYEFYKTAGLEFDKHLTPTKFIRQAINRSKIILSIDSPS